MIYFDEKNTVFRSTLLDTYPLVYGFGTKQFGDGRRISTLERYLTANSAPYQVIVVPRQIHSDIVYTISDFDSHSRTHSIDDTDGLITLQSGVMLSVVTADCVPIIYFDPVKKVIAVSHQGWKGTLSALPQKVIDGMKSLGSKPQDIICILGPAINECCYTVDVKRQDVFTRAFGSSVIQRIRLSGATLSLYKANRLTLLKNGIKEEHLDIFPFCTSCNSEQFYSYRRQRGITGEMTSFVMVK